MKNKQINACARAKKHRSVGSQSGSRSHSYLVRSGPEHAIASLRDAEISISGSRGRIAPQGKASNLTYVIGLG